MCTFKIAVVCLLLTSFVLSKDEKIRYFSVQRVNVTWLNTKYLTHLTAKSFRYNRQDPVYYFNVTFGTKLILDNKYMADIYFYEWLTNVYKRSFVEMHWKFCDLINKDVFFGTALRQSHIPCPLLPGDYEAQNCTIPATAIPRTFPFTKGRIYGNLTHIPTNEFIASGHCDIELKEMKKKIN